MKLYSLSVEHHKSIMGPIFIRVQYVRRLSTGCAVSQLGDCVRTYFEGAKQRFFGRGQRGSTSKRKKKNIYIKSLSVSMHPVKI